MPYLTREQQEAMTRRRVIQPPVDAVSTDPPRTTGVADFVFWFAIATLLAAIVSLMMSR